MAEFPTINCVTDINEINLAQLEKALQRSFLKDKLYTFGEEPESNVRLIGDPALQQFKYWVATQPSLAIQVDPTWKTRAQPFSGSFVELGVGTEVVDHNPLPGVRMTSTPMRSWLDYLQTLPNPVHRVGMSLDGKSFFVTGAALYAMWKKTYHMPKYMRSPDLLLEFMKKFKSDIDLGTVCKPIPIMNAFGYIKSNSTNYYIIWPDTQEVPAWLSASFPDIDFSVLEKKKTSFRLTSLIKEGLKSSFEAECNSRNLFFVSLPHPYGIKYTVTGEVGNLGELMKLISGHGVINWQLEQN